MERPGVSQCVRDAPQRGATRARVVEAEDDGVMGRDRGPSTGVAEGRKRDRIRLTASSIQRVPYPTFKPPRFTDAYPSRQSRFVLIW
jgi:hypothetical protein